MSGNGLEDGKRGAAWRNQGDCGRMSPVEDDPTVWGVLAKIGKAVLESLSFAAPFVGPAFIGAVLSASRRSYRDKSLMYWFSAVMWSTAAGTVLAPLFAEVMGFSDNAARSSAALLALLGHEGVGLIFRKTGLESEAKHWDGMDRRNRKGE